MKTNLRILTIVALLITIGLPAPGIAHQKNDKNTEQVKKEKMAKKEERMQKKAAKSLRNESRYF
ncbi:MAG: hypothetical protein ACLQQ4_15965 [Bacteroidia bacterium]